MDLRQKNKNGSLKEDKSDETFIDKGGNGGDCRYRIVCGFGTSAV